jgi:hypothetical protein
MVGPTSTYQHDTPSANLEVDTASTVEVVDPTHPLHPLHGRQLPLIRFSPTLTGPGLVWVVSRDFMQLRIPLASTNLVPDHPTTPTTFTEQAIADLVNLVNLVGAGGVGEAETTKRRPSADSPTRDLATTLRRPPAPEQR